MPWFDKMCNSEYNTQDDAKATNHDIGDSQEGILAAHDSPCRYQNRLGATVYLDREICTG